jgi:hypothetical protein
MHIGKLPQPLRHFAWARDRLMIDIRIRCHFLSRRESGNDSAGMGFPLEMEIKI